ncbi:MAG TPA: hypothetical protein PKI19_07100 [Elusimicrobiales bacterium]|nr:hypothetical protein [Elusimicrobiales bacterium]
MKKSSFVCAALFLALSVPSFAGEFRDKGETIAVDFPAGWVQGKSDDPVVTLKLEKGKSTFEFAKQDSELSDYYLKARVKENAESLRNKGASFSGDVKPITLHGVSSAYYAAYELLGSRACMAFFTYNGASYSVAALNMDEGDFRGVLSSVRKPGEKIELPKKPKLVRVKKEKEKEEPDSDSDVGIFKDEEAKVSSAAAAAVTASAPAPEQPAAAVADEGPSAAQAMADSAGRAAQNLFDDLAKKTGDKSAAPYYERHPLPLLFWGALLAFWLLGSFAARGVAAAYQNPRLGPPPAEVPPDFFFPFVVSKTATFKEVTYNVRTRQKQLLMASFPYEHEFALVVAVYGCAFFHAAWSLFEFTGRGAAVIGAFLWLPGGRFFASIPEIFFLVPFMIGLMQYITKKRVMMLYDAQSNLIMEGRKEITYCLIRDGAGKEVARLVPKAGGVRRWDFVDTDNLVIFSIQDDCPKIRTLRKIFGNLGGALRARYGIFVQDRRAGFVFLDPSSTDRFQVHMDYAFSRLAPPAQILIALLYVISMEKDPVYPSPF